MPRVGERVAGRHRHRHSPRMRRLAANLGVSLDQVSGTGPAGRLLADDVHRAATDVDRPAPVAPTAAAALSTVVEADVTSLVERLGEPDAADGATIDVRVTLTALIARAALEALRALPLLNSSIDADGRSVAHNPTPHLGIAVDTDQGVVVPVLRDAGDLNARALARRISELTQRAGDATSDELSGGTFTLADIGSRGVLFEMPALVAGQVATLGVGSVADRPVVITGGDGQRAIAIRSIVHLALTYDPRAVSGADAARFLHLVCDRLDTKERHVSR